jgi:hypothetical protein
MLAMTNGYLWEDGVPFTVVKQDVADGKWYMIGEGADGYLYSKEVSEQQIKDIVMTDTATNNFSTLVTIDGAVSIVPYTGSSDNATILSMLTQLKECICPTGGVNFTMMVVGD